MRVRRRPFSMKACRLRIANTYVEPGDHRCVPLRWKVGDAAGKVVGLVVSVPSDGVARNTGRDDGWGAGHRLLLPVQQCALLPALAANRCVPDRSGGIFLRKRTKRSSVRVQMDFAAQRSLCLPSVGGDTQVDSLQPFRMTRPDASSNAIRRAV